MSDGGHDDRTVVVDRIDNVAVIHLARPKLNVLSLVMLNELEACLGALREEPPGAVVVTGSDSVFAAGADLDDLSDETRAPELTDAFRRAFDALSGFPRVTIAAIAGFALGGGCELALACDFRFAATSARIGLPEVGLGIFPGGGGTQRLARIVGVTVAKDLIFSGRLLDGADALAAGLVSRLCEPATLFDEAIAAAATFARGPVVAHGLAKEAIDRGLDLPLSSGLDLERLLFDAARATEDAHAGLASFLANGPGKAAFVGR